jgi:fumarate hydratase class II
MNFREEKDTMGIVKVPADKYWGAQTQRALTNFRIGREKMPIEVIHAYAVIKSAASQVNTDLGLLDKKKNKLIKQVADEILSGQLDTHFPLMVWQTGSGTQTNMNVNEVIANRAYALDKSVILHPNDDVNKSQSTNDTFPTAMNLAAYKLLVEKTIPSVKKLRDSLKAKSKEFSNIVKMGRTHWMDATPICLGQEFSGYVSQLDKGISNCKASLKHLSQLAIGGTAVGTGLNAPKGFDKKAVEYISGITGYNFKPAPNKFEAIAAHEPIIAAHATLKQLAVSLMKICNDIRALSSGPRGGLYELSVPANEPGSSIMPGKVNPTQIEAATMVCTQVIGNDNAISVGGMQGHFELNAFKPVICYNFIQSAGLLADISNSLSDKCISGIVPNKKKIKEYVNNSLMLVTALNTHIGYEKAAEIAKIAYEKKISLKEATLKTGYMNEKKYNMLIDVKKMTNS